MGGTQEYKNTRTHQHKNTRTPDKKTTTHESTQEHKKHQNTRTHQKGRECGREREREEEEDQYSSFARDTPKEDILSRSGRTTKTVCCTAYC